MKRVEKGNKLKDITTIAERRGLFFPTAEIYGGKAGFYTYGHLGKSMKNKFENLFRNYFFDENCYEIDGNAILPKPVFKASGHIESFNDPLTECKACHFRFRADQLIEDSLGIDAEGLSTGKMDALIKKHKLGCPKCKSDRLAKVKWFNMMFPVELGSAGLKELAYLSPETAQNPYLSFKREFEATRRKLPLGIAMIGKAFRNEISPRQLFFRLREFTQAELQIFFDSAKMNELESVKWRKIAKYKLLLLPVSQRRKGKILEMSCEQANKRLKLPKLYLYYMARMQKFYFDCLCIPKAKFRIRELSKEERAHYNKFHWDMEVELETLGGFKEISGLHYRTDHDLGGHGKYSKRDLSVFIDGKKFVPHVIELSFGVDRNVFASLDVFFKREKERTLFKFPSVIAPLDVSVFPLVSKDGLPAIAEKVYELLKEDFAVFYDESGSIGRRYRRADEVGCPFAVTVDYQTKKNKTVTVRNRDSMKQKRVKIFKLVNSLNLALRKV